MKQLLFTLAFVLLTACGYQLKQAVELDPAYDKTFIQLALTAPLYRPLAAAISNQGVQLVEQASEATAKLIIEKDSLTKQVQSIGTNNRVQEYRLDYELTFSVQFLDQKIINGQTLNLSQDYAFDIGQITGAQSEERILRQQMYKDMAQKVIRAIANQAATNR